MGSTQINFTFEVLHKMEYIVSTDLNFTSNTLFLLTNFYLYFKIKKYKIYQFTHLHIAQHPFFYPYETCNSYLIWYTDAIMIN
jgi:hypothetical protein